MGRLFWRTCWHREEESFKSFSSGWPKISVLLGARRSVAGR